MLDKILIFTMSLCIIVFSGCMPEDGPGSPLEEYSADANNSLMGKWKMAMKYSYRNNTLYSVEDVSDEGNYIEFTKNRNNKYGNFMSNMYPKEAYYIITRYAICFYFSLDSLNKSSHLYDYAINTSFYFRKIRDTLSLRSFDGWFGDSSIEFCYDFIKMEK